jgi:hypothetical protein
MSMPDEDKRSLSVTLVETVDEALRRTRRLIIEAGGNIVAADSGSLTGYVHNRRKPSWTKTIAVGALGVVPAVLYRTWGTRDSNDSFLFEFFANETDTVVRCAGHGDGLVFVGRVLDALEDEAGVAYWGTAAQRWAEIPRSTSQELWTALYDNDAEFERSLKDLEVLLTKVGLSAAQLTHEQVDLIADSAWSSAPQKLLPEAASELAAQLLLGEETPSDG